MNVSKMNIEETERMGDVWDYHLRKLEIAWELAQRVIPKQPQEHGAWIEANYFKKVQEILKDAYEIVNTTFPTKL